MVAVTGQGLVDGVVHDLVDQMVQSALTGGTDIHAGALAHRFQALQDLNLTGVVLVVRRGFHVGAGDDFLCHILSPFLIFYRKILLDGLFSAPFHRGAGQLRKIHRIHRGVR